MDIESSDDWYGELETNVNKLFKAKDICVNCFDSHEKWDKVKKEFTRQFEESLFKSWDDSEESILVGFTSYINRSEEELGLEAFDEFYFKKQAERLLKLLTNFDGVAVYGNSNQIKLTFKTSESHKCNLVWLLIIIAYLLKVHGHQDDFSKFACSFNDLVGDLKIGGGNSSKPENESTINQFSVTADKGIVHGETQSNKTNYFEETAKKWGHVQSKPEHKTPDHQSSVKSHKGIVQSETESNKTNTQSKQPKVCQPTNQADTLILILAQKYLSQLQEIGERNHLELNDINNILKKYEWVWHGDANKKPNPFETDIKGNLCWIEIVFDKSKSKKSISSRIDFNDLMRAIDNDTTFVQSLSAGEPFQMNGSGLTEKGFKKI